MTEHFYNVIGDRFGEHVHFIAVVDENGVELSGGAYIRQAVRWAKAVNGNIAFSNDLNFDCQQPVKVSGWRGYSAQVGGTDFGGPVFPELLIHDLGVKLVAHLNGIQFGPGSGVRAFSRLNQGLDATAVYAARESQRTKNDAR